MSCSCQALLSSGIGPRWFPCPFANPQASPNIPSPFTAVSPMALTTSVPYSTSSSFLFSFFFLHLSFSHQDYDLLKGIFWISHSFCLTHCVHHIVGSQEILVKKCLANRMFSLYLLANQCQSWPFVPKEASYRKTRCHSTHKREDSI